MLLNNLIIGSGTKSFSVGYAKHQFNKSIVGSGLKTNKQTNSILDVCNCLIISWEVSRKEGCDLVLITGRV